MRTLRLSLGVAVVMMILFTGVMASARGGGHRGGRGGSHFGIVIGGPYWGPAWYSPYYYPLYDPFYYPFYYPYAPVVTAPSVPEEYIERPRNEQSYESSEPSGFWYYCRKSKAYYPYVKECPGGWQKVPAQPPSEPER